ncbi:CAP-Gly domain-containing linker protein 1-like [Scomber scombrus]|uniref:CAP-Gly domain-containing linker protein 1-like n=1 Tax=Scomber scombrus TaxID=13677 RepID=A0AAV1PMC6_SCOSC
MQNWDHLLIPKETKDYHEEEIEEVNLEVFEDLTKKSNGRKTFSKFAEEIKEALGSPWIQTDTGDDEDSEEDTGEEIKGEIKEETVEEEIVEEEIVEEEIVEDNEIKLLEFQDLTNNVEEETFVEHFHYEEEDDKEEVAEDVEEKSIASEKEKSSYSSFSEESEKQDWRQGHNSTIDLEEDGKAKDIANQEQTARAAIEEALDKEHIVNPQMKECLEQEQKENAALKSALEQAKEHLKQEQKANNAFEEALQKEDAEKARLCSEIEQLKTQTAYLSKSLRQQEDSNKTLKGKVKKMVVNRKEDKTLIEKLEELKYNLEVSSLQCKKENDKREKELCVKIKALEERNTETKDNSVYSMQQKVDQLESDLKGDRSMLSKLQRECDDAVSQQQSLTQEKRQLASENTKLQGDLKAALNESNILVKQLQDAKDEAIVTEKVQFKKVLKELEMIKAELKEKNSALENSLLAEKHLKSSLEQEKKRFNYALEEAPKKEEAEKARLCSEIEHLKTQTADLSKSLEQHQDSNKRLKGKVEKMVAYRKEDKTLIEKLEELKHNLEVSSLQSDKENDKREKELCVKIKALEERLVEMNDERLNKDSEIQSLYLNIQHLRGTTEAKDNSVYSMRQKVDQLESDLMEDRSMISKLQRECDHAVSQQQSLTQEKRQLASENTKLQGELQAALKENKLRNQLQEENRKGTEKVQFKKLLKELKILKAELKEKNSALENSLLAEKYLKSSLEQEKKRFEQTLSQQQAEDNPPLFLNNQLRGACTPSGHMTYDMQTLWIENANVRAKYRTMEKEYDRVKSQNCSFSDQYDELVSKKIKSSLTIKKP